MRTYTYRFLVSLLFLINLNYLAICQQSSRNGFHATTVDTLRVLVVYAEVVNDPNYYTNNTATWAPGQMPDDPDYLFDHVFNSSSINGMVTKLYEQASFNRLKVIGDYVNSLAQINYADLISSGNDSGEPLILDWLKNIPSSDIATAHNYSFNSNDFDKWEFGYTFGYIKDPITDGYIDMLCVVWRVNSRFNTYDQSGRMYSRHLDDSIKLKAGFANRAYVTNFDGQGWESVRHEIAHSLLGENEYHTVGKTGGTRTFIAPPGGFSLLNYHASIGDTYNAFDRYRLGWKHPGNTYYISARDASSGGELCADTVYNKNAPSQEYVLRDFVTYGDAIRIKLPYLQYEDSRVYDQFLWLENHQMKPGNIDLDKDEATGIYAYIQVGKSSLNLFNEGYSGYLYPLQAFGNYDVDYSDYSKSLVNPQNNSNDEDMDYLIGVRPEINNEKSGDDRPLYINTSNANPLTGYNMLQGLSFNFIDPNIVEGPTGTVYVNDEIFGSEVSYPTSLVIDGVEIDTSYFAWDTYPCFGSLFDPFNVPDIINMCSNPPSSSVLTYATASNEPWDDPQFEDPKTVHLNGLSIKFVEQYTDGSIKLRVKYNDYAVNKSVRWCGPIMLHDSLKLKMNNTITLDQGLTPTRPLNPIPFNGEYIYASPTTFICDSNSAFVLEANSEVVVKNNSAFLLEPFANLIIEGNAVFRVQEGSTLLLKSNSSLTISEEGRLEIEDGAYICVEDDYIITVQDELSVINLRKNYNSGVNTEVITEVTNCISDASSVGFTGSGRINDFNDDIKIQNEVIGEDVYYGGNTISTGYSVDPSQPYGNVVIENGNQVIFVAHEGVLLDEGFEVEAGAEFLITVN